MSQQAIAGVVYVSADALSYLPLEEVEVRALVVDGKCLSLWRVFVGNNQVIVSARVDVIQTFYNPSRDSTPRAKYLFPLPAQAAVCAFDMGTSFGRVIVGVAKEKQQAQEDFEQAIQRGKKTALVEWGTGDSTFTDAPLRSVLMSRTPKSLQSP